MKNRVMSQVAPHGGASVGEEAEERISRLEEDVASLSSARDAAAGDLEGTKKMLMAEVGALRWSLGHV